MNLSRLLPDGLAARFALLLTVALIAANVVALGLLSFERQRLDRAARESREIERIVSLVPAIEAAPAESRQAIAADASTRFSKVSVTARPIFDTLPRVPRSQGLTEALSEVLPGRELRAAILSRPPRGDEDSRQRPARRETLVASIRLAGTPTQWLNIVTRGNRPRPPGVQEGVFLILICLSLLAVLAVGLIFVRRLTRPLAALAEAARAAGRGDRSARVPEEGAREMRAAARAFNDMQARIARFDAERMRTLAAVGHDLRTPITSLRIRAELLDSEEAEPMIRTLEEMGVMAEGLVAYAKGDGDGETSQQIDLAALLARLCGDRGATCDADTRIDLQGKPVALGRALGNLIDNAQRYGGGARVSLALSGQDALVRVEDDGPGIPEPLLGTVFDPFVRGEDSRSSETGGAGLGLAIARNIITAHGGTITLENREAGGLRATVRLPGARLGPKG